MTAVFTLLSVTKQTEKKHKQFFAKYDAKF